MCYTELPHFLLWRVSGSGESGPAPRFLALLGRMGVLSVRKWEVSSRRNFQREDEESGFGHVMSVLEAPRGQI